MRKTKQVSIAVSSALFIGVTVANAAVSPIGPFVGTMSETWDTFAPGNYGTSKSIMGGKAQVTDTWGILVFASGSISMGSSGSAKATDGSQLVYIQGTPSTTITFGVPINNFGAYWGGHTGIGHPDPQVVGLTFKDVNGVIIDSVSYQYSHTATGDGLLDWHGWSSSVGIKSIFISHSLQIMTDGFQASAIPEPSTYLAGLSALGMLGLFGWRNRK